MSRRTATPAVETTATFGTAVVEPRDEFGDVGTADPILIEASYVVVRPCVVVTGERGSRGTFYEGPMARSWDCGNGRDSATQEELDRLVELGFIRAV
jgi:hypothetical protein